MPPRWSRVPDRKDPDFRRLDDRMTFATHVATFAAVNSALWFFHGLGDRLEIAPLGDLFWLPWFTGLWASGLLIHAVAIFAIVRYDPPSQS
mgnify:CR=1 FL=1